MTDDQPGTEADATAGATTSWAQWVLAVTGGANTKAIARHCGLNQSNVYRWINSGAQPDPRSAAQFARAYGRNPIEAFLALGWLNAADANPATGSPDPRLLTVTGLMRRTRDLLDEIERRLSTTGAASDEPRAAEQPPAPGHQTSATPATLEGPHE